VKLAEFHESRKICATFTASSSLFKGALRNLHHKASAAALAGPFDFIKVIVTGNIFFSRYLNRLFSVPRRDVRCKERLPNPYRLIRKTHYISRIFQS